jgi:hypothetical protein
MKFRITRYEQANGTVFYKVEKRSLMWRPLYTDLRAIHMDAGPYETREEVIYLIDAEVAHFKAVRKEDKSSKIVKTTVDYITKEV